MLEKMSTAQYVQLLAYFRIRSEARESGKAEADEVNLMQFLARKAARQKEGAWQ